MSSSSPTSSPTPTSSTNSPSPPPPLALSTVSEIQKRSQFRSILLGAIGGMTAMLITKSSLGLSKNVSVLSGLITGCGVSYVMVQREIDREVEMYKPTSSFK